MIKHGMRYTRFYKIWCGVKSRCLDKKCKDYKNYGGKGITLSNKWLKFTGFMEDMLISYVEHLEKYGEKQTTIDRINSKGHYAKINCKWSTMKEQENNKDKTYLKNRLKGKDGKYIKKAQELKEEANKLK